MFDTLNILLFTLTIFIVVSEVYTVTIVNEVTLFLIVTPPSDLDYKNRCI